MTMNLSSTTTSSNYLAYILKEIESSSSTSSTTLTNSTNSNNSSNTVMSASDIFDKLTEELGGDGESVSKSDLESYIEKVQSDTTGSYDKGELGFLTQLDNNWDSISNGSDTITESDIENGMSYLQPPTQGTNTDSLSNDLYSSLLEAVDSDGDGTISKSDLTTYLSDLLKEIEDQTDSDNTATNSSTTTSDTSSTDSTKELNNEIKFVADLLENFSDYTGDDGTISSSSFYSALNQPQDYSTVTAEQLESPISLLV